MASPGFADAKAKGRILRSWNVTPSAKIDHKSGSFVQHKPSRIDEVIGRLADTTVAEVICQCSTFKMVKPGRAPWCEHMQEFYIKNIDGFDQDAEGQYEELPGRVAVTVFTNPGLVGWVELGPPSVPESYRVVTPLSMRTGMKINGPEVIGILTPGTGRGVLRSYVMDLLLTVNPHDYHCGADWHSGYLPWDIDGFDPRDKRHLCHLADLLWTGVCRTCNEDNGVPDI